MFVRSLNDWLSLLKSVLSRHFAAQATLLCCSRVSLCQWRNSLQALLGDCPSHTPVVHQQANRSWCALTLGQERVFQLPVHRQANRSWCAHN